MEGDDERKQIGLWLWPVSALPIIGTAMFWAIGIYSDWDGQAAILTIPFMGLVLLSPGVVIFGLIAYAIKKWPIFLWVTLWGLVQCAAIPVSAVVVNKMDLDHAHR